MSDQEKPSEKAIPEWQRERHSDSSLLTSKEGSPNASNEHTEDIPGSRAALIEQASKFLEDHATKPATMERKIQFLESKGLTNHEIFEMLGIARKEDDSSKVDSEDKAKKLAPREHSEERAQTAASGSHTSATTDPSADTPPIITYPEFLMHSSKPPPLITTQRLLNTLYLITGATATMYGASKFVLKPMFDSLSTARHSLFEIAAANLDTLNEKLEKIVSIVPGPSIPHVNDSSSLDLADTDTEATEFFHRSTATQTSPDLSRSNSSLSTQAPQTLPSPIISQSAQLQTLHKELSSLVPHSEADNTLETRLSELQTYLGGMAYGGNLQFGKVGGEETDEISKVKTEIRGVKGVLLSARNFPSGVGSRIWG